MDQMEEQPLCEVGRTAIGDLLETVRMRLLLVRLPHNLGIITPDADSNRLHGRSSVRPEFVQDGQPPPPPTVAFKAPDLAAPGIPMVSITPPPIPLSWSCMALNGRH
jgi:hypothetical protein